jgi:hypothetical protein
MVATLAIAIPSGLHIALSVVLGYAIRISEGLPAETKPFTLFGFIFGALLAVIAVSMIMFFAGSIPTMAYSMALVAGMLRWVGKRWGRVKLASAIIGSVAGLIVGILGSLLLRLLMDLNAGWSLYAALFRWPAILTIDGIALLWTTLNPLAQAAAGAQIGWRLGKQLEEISMYWFW